MEASSYIHERMNSPCRKVESIPEDIMIEILLRLPVKSLLCFKLVCKRWYYLMKDTQFICMHHKLNLSAASQLLSCRNERYGEDECARYNHVFSFHSNYEESTSLEILENRHNYVHVADCCNGIICCYDSYQDAIFLFNPATRDFKELPPTSFQLGRIDPKFQHIGVAVGFDSPNTYDFKVLCMFFTLGKDRNVNSTHSETSTRAEMYTLSSNTWRQLDWGLNNEIVFRGYGLFCANSFHFTARDFVKENIVCCEIHTVRFKVMNFPLKPKDDRGNFLDLMVFKGFLSAACSYPWENCEGKPLEIWVMKDYGVVESWTKLYSIESPSARPLCFWMDDQVLLLLQNSTDNLVSFQLNTLDLKSIKINGYKMFTGVRIFRETLVSIK